MPEIALESVTKVFPGRVRAVRDLSLQVEDGEFVVLVGPSGCGKTTTLRLIAGLEEPTAGTIRIAGRCVNGVHPGDRDVAMVFQDSALYPHMTVRRNLSFGLEIRKVSKREIAERVQSAAALLGVQDLLDRKPSALSGGERQRVAVGRAMVLRPGCFLFDEPLSNLDARLRMLMRAELKALHRRLGTTTVYVTHDQEEAMSLGERLVVLDEGVVQQTGAPLEVYRGPKNRFVADFVGSPPMNFIDGRVEAIAGSVRFTDGHDVAFPVPAPLAGRLAGLAAGEVVLGVRPEHLRPPGNGAVGAIEIAFVIDVHEPLGDRVIVSGTIAGGPRVSAQVNADARLAVGDRVSFAVDAAHVHFFERGEHGRRI